MGRQASEGYRIMCLGQIECAQGVQKLRLECLPLPALSRVVSRVLGAAELSLKDDCDMQIKLN